MKEFFQAWSAMIDMTDSRARLNTYKLDLMYANRLNEITEVEYVELLQQLDIRITTLKRSAFALLYGQSVHASYSEVSDERVQELADLLDKELGR